MKKKIDMVFIMLTLSAIILLIAIAIIMPVVFFNAITVLIILVVLLFSILFTNCVIKGKGHPLKFFMEELNKKELEDNESEN